VATPNAIANLTKPQKAAAILVAMGKPSASRLLKFFKQDELKSLIEAARLLRTIPQSDLEKIVAEFEAEFTEGAGLIDSADQMDTILTESLSEEEVKALKMPEGANDAKGPPPVWPEVDKLDPTRITAFLAAEHPQTAAFIMSKLQPAKASAVMFALDKGLRGEVIKRMLSISTISPAAIKLVEGQVRSRLLAQGSTKDVSAGQTRVASVLNELDKSQLDQVLADLEAAGTPGLEAIRARLFSFEDIINLTQKARVAVFDGLSSELVTMALRGADAGLGEAILSSIGARSRRMIEAELSAGGDVPAAEIVKARKAIASQVIRMAREGTIELPSVQEAA